MDIRWIDRPQWALLPLPATKIDGLTERIIEKPGQPVIQWEFSNATWGFWAWLLATIIKQLELAVNGVRIVRETQKEDGKGEIEDIHTWCHRLYAYLHWKVDVAQTLLTKTSLKYSFRLRNYIQHGRCVNLHPPCTSCYSFQNADGTDSGEFFFFNLKKPPMEATSNALLRCIRRSAGRAWRK